MSLVELITGPVLKIIDKIIPDPQAKAQAQLELWKLQQAGELRESEQELQLALAQIELNKVEAGTDIFRGGWRPFVGWVCGSGLAYQFVVRPIIGWIGENLAHWTMPPTLEMETLMTLLLGMLGLGGLRTAEKLKGKA